MSDPYYDNVSLLLHCDGSNGSTTFTDNSPAPKTVTVVGNANISTAQSKFGGASALFDGSGDYLTLDGSSGFDFGTGDFTIELWFRSNSSSADQFIYDSRPSGTANGAYPALTLDRAAAGGKLVYYVNSGFAITSTTAPAINTWYHFALCRSGSSTKLFIDGVQEGSTYTNSTSMTVGASSPVIGGNGFSRGTNSVNGYIDDLRVTKGVARYTSNFTPHTAAHPDSGPVPLIGILALTGQLPTIASGHALTPSIGQVNLTGLIPNLSIYAFFGTPVICNLAIVGQSPSTALGFAIDPSIGNLLLTGQTPTLAHGWSAAPSLGSADIIGLQPKHSNYTFFGIPSIGQINIDGLQPGYALGFAAAPSQRQIVESGQQPSFANRLLYVIENYWISTHYRCSLTGSPDSLSDLELPISSFQTRMAASPVPRAYLSVIVPGIDSYIDSISARPNGRLKVDRIYNYLDGSSASFAMVNVPFETINTNQGGRSGMTGTMTGFEETGDITPQSITLSGPATRSSDNGGIRYRCQMDPRLRPNDTVTINGETFAVESVIHIVDAKTSIMEIREKL